MRALDAVSEQGPQLLGVMLSCAQNYATLDDLAFDQGRKDRLLYSLLNARLALSALRGALLLKHLEYPQGLRQLRVDAPTGLDAFGRLSIPCTGDELYNWASSVEASVCRVLDSFKPLEEESLEGHDGLHALSLLRPEMLTFKGKPVANRTLVLIDDVHKLTSSQRRRLLTNLLDLRAPVGVWLAERLEALDVDEVLAEGATTDREYGEPIKLEDYWRAPGRARRFEEVVTNIADRRVKSVPDVQVSSFAAHIEESLDGTEWQDAYLRAIDQISERIRTTHSASGRYQEWIHASRLQNGTPRERAIAWRSLEILIERDARKTQLSFDLPDLPLPSEDLEKKDASGVRGAAEFFLAREFGLPYYFGMSRVSTLASSNIEQFLALAGDLFEEVVAAEIMKVPSVLNPARQEAILKREVQKRVQEVPRRVQDGRDVQRFLEAVRQCAHWETNKPNAPYAPGVTGFAMSMSDRSRLIDRKTRTPRPEYERLARVLTACITHNLLEPSLDRSQGQKGQTWMILYLNRFLCLGFGLPLQYGGWRAKSIEELNNWIDGGFRPPRNGEALL